MKKRILALAIVVVLMLSIAALPASAAAEMKIYRLATQPVLDGAISDGEYYLLADDSNYKFTISDNEEGDMAKADKKFYAGYDDTYLYLGIAITCECHVNEWVFVADGGENDYDIYDGHSAMIAVTPVNPATDPDCIATLTNDNWNWSDAFKSVIARQFTIALTSDTGIQLSGVHFSHTNVYVPESTVYTDEKTGGTIRYNAANDANLPMTTDFFKVAHDASNYDIYECKIPWGWIDYKTDKKGNKGDNVITEPRKDGSYCGLSVNVTSGDIDQDVYMNGGLATCTFGAERQIYFGEYVPLYLAGNADASATASAKLGTPGSSASNATTTKGATADTTASANAGDTTTTGDKADATTKAPKTTTKKATTATKADTTKKDDEKKSDSNTGLIIAIIAAAVVVIAVVVIIIVVKKKKGAAPKDAPKADDSKKE